MAATPAAEENKELVRRYMEILEAEEFDRLDEVLASDYTVHGVPGAEEELTGPDAIEAFFQDWSAAFPDMTATIEELVAEDDRVAYRATFTGTQEGEFMDIPASGEAVSVDATGFFRIEGGKLAEAWPQFDTLGMMQQLGVMEAPGE